MKRILSIVLLLLVFGCKENSEKQKPAIDKPVKVDATKDVNSATANITKVFETHGLKQWKNQRTLSFTIPKPNAAETHTIDLYTRKEKIETSDWATGSNGKDIWLLDPKGNYKGDPIFYHNLMFYFFSMPFVMADKGIHFSETEDLVFEGKSYPGVHVSFSDNVGISSKDEYYLHYDSDTFKMAWLGYTVTYRSGEKSNDVKWIHYNDWNEISKMKLPNSISWYTSDGRKINELSKTVKFENVQISEKVKSDDFYAIPENAKVVPRTK
ncbi:hypothetical protein JQC67_11045 [Aurantibacter crassamenti]|uniref:DUF6503 family protein n=1 Tax=Aurantibacter crassamenti TaxID=1837375 RepID=UPI0019392F03|nr:DUF6503 family protein [Aurantibacter crassamenti]MBM1106675.1 hypothetical protein [Aurantibacter crassamenti]